MDAKPKRPWYQFSLRTMFVVVTLVCVVLAWVGYSLNWKRETQEANLARTPLFTGKLEGGTFWKYPLSAANNEGGGYANGSRIDVYEQFVVVTTSDGISYVHLHGYHSGLAIKKD
jgi:hypothetical protein